MKHFLKNRYEIIKVLGKGGMGWVYKVRDRKHKGMVLAVKELQSANLSRDKAQEALVQFQTEAQILARLTHPNLPKVYDYFSLNKAHYIVMEYIKGSTLEQILLARRGKPVAEELALSWGLQICRAMHFLSVQRPRPIVFRDLKPANIMISRDNRIRLIDFGIARFFKAEKKEDTFLYGTPGYAAPEQYGSGQTDVRSDIFSLGATLHHCVTGRNPAENPLIFPAPRSLNPRLSRETAGLITCALAQDINKRFQNALEMKLAIQKILLRQPERGKEKRRIIYARPGKVITIPWWNNTSWVSVPVMSLGLSGTTGTLSTDDRWIKAKPLSFGPDANRLLFRVEGNMLRPGQEYGTNITVRTDAGIVRPRLVLKRSWPWMLIEAAMLAGAIMVMVMLR